MHITHTCLASEVEEDIFFISEIIREQDRPRPKTRKAKKIFKLFSILCLIMTVR